MQEADLEVKDGYIQYSSADYRSGYDRMNALLDLEERPTAVFCSDDAIASYAVRAALDRGLRVPEDIKITGYDDTPITSLLRIPITSVNQNRSRLAEKATDLLSAMIEGKEIENGRYVVPVNLVERKSTGK